MADVPVVDSSAVSPAERLPAEPALTTVQLPGVGGHVGPELEDFQVDELPLYPASGEGQHWYVRLCKRGLNTRDLVRIVARASGAHEPDVGSAGMKDKHAVTTQWLSVLDARVTPPNEWVLPPEVELLECTRHANKLRTGHLAGNHFRIRLVNLEADPETARTRVEQLVTEIEQRGLLNYFGAQRFGIAGGNLTKAFAWLARPRRGSRFDAKLYPSVIQSEVFNRYLALRSATGLDRLLDGEVVRLANSSRCFVVEKPEDEQQRLNEGDIVLTGPMIGPKAQPAKREANALEQRAVAELGITEKELTQLARFAPGTRRDLVVKPEALQAQVTPDGALVLDFSLPAGSYATQLVREFTREAFLSGQRH